MSEWELRDPMFLFAALLAPVVFWLAWRARSTVTYSSLGLFARTPRSLRVRLAWVPPCFLALATAALGVALAGPRTGDSTTKVKREGIAISMVVDRSGSMKALDLSLGDEMLTRLDAVKRVFRDFVTGTEGFRGRPDDLVGLIAFAEYADGLCPLTLDHANLLLILEDLDFPPGNEANLTAIGEGLALAVEHLRRQTATSKVAILLTDGDNNAGDVSPQQAAELAAAHGIKVYTIGAGTIGLAPVMVEDQFGNKRLRQTRVHIDEATLQEIAAKTGGRYFRATDHDGLAAVVAEIDKLERSEITELRYLDYTERYGELVVAALALIAASCLASGFFLRRLP